VLKLPELKVLNEITPFEPTIILLYTFPKKQKLNGRLITFPQVSSIATKMEVPAPKLKGGV
jgi:hypothetical protein